jgi:hypothetical protein
MRVGVFIKIEIVVRTFSLGQHHLGITIIWIIRRDLGRIKTQLGVAFPLMNPLSCFFIEG